ncbi:MAG: hypothetical protein AAF639_37845 [Chloroflexota bacterium]
MNAFAVIQLFAIMMVIIGIYRFARIWVSPEAATYAPLLIVFSSSINETIHVFGQLPTTFSLGFLLNALAYAHRWFDTGDRKTLIVAWIFIAATTAGHHVTTLFGSVFFVAPVMVLAIVEQFRRPLPDEPPQHPGKVTRENIRPLLARRLRRVMPALVRCGVYGVGMIILLVIVVFPYWVLSITDPIAQVPIPHASRDSFIENIPAGLVFWIVPYGVTLIALPYAFFKGLTTKAWPMALSLGLLFVLGTGGTTPIPEMLLGSNAFNILTLDRFTFWATITVIPLLGEFIVSLRERNLAKYMRQQFGDVTWRASIALLLVAYLAFCVFTANLTHFRKFQPDFINVQPITSFLDKDEHWRWRYLTLGFGDQVAWLSTNTTATSVDGNYHSARRLPELTTTSIERLEGAKFRGIAGIGSLQQFLAVPDKYNLKYIFSNDQFYDPLLYFSGWHRVQRLENGIMVWEREGIPQLPEVLPRKEIPTYQRMMWGILPISSLVMAMMAMFSSFWVRYFVLLMDYLGVRRFAQGGRSLFVKIPVLVWSERLWNAVDARLLKWLQLPENDDSRLVRWQVWMDVLARIPRPKPAAPSGKVVRTTLLVLMIAGFLGLGTRMVLNYFRDPIVIVQSYYDDLDFRRFVEAYERFDPETRPAYDEYILNLSVVNGIIASYGKLDAVTVEVLQQEDAYMQVQANLHWVTALAEYDTTEILELVRRGIFWYIVPLEPEVFEPAEGFFRRPTVDWLLQTGGENSPEAKAFGDILAQPYLQILSAQLVQRELPECFSETSNHGALEELRDECTRYSVVGEIFNADVGPADVTVKAYLYDDENEELSWYNAQQIMMHKLLPKEVTPFRVEFEGVAGAKLEDLNDVGDFRPDAFTPIDLRKPIAAFDVFAESTITTRDLYRDVTTQNLTMIERGGDFYLQGQLFNTGIQEATVPHILITFYDENNQVVWVDHAYIERAVRPHYTLDFEVPVTHGEEVGVFLSKGDLYDNLLTADVSSEDEWVERIPAPAGLGYHSYRVSVHYFVGIVQ